MSELPRPGALIAGRYRIESVLGQGGMGAVFAAEDTSTGRAVALKWLKPSAAESVDAVLRFMAEARATAKIDHPNVVTIIDVGREGQSPVLVMERLRGESLGKRLARGPLSVIDALDIVVAACRGVAEAHAEGVIHRDLKPDNIFLCESSDGRPIPKVVDFGIAKLKEAQSAVALTKTGVVLGTPAYMSPEQIGKPREADPRFDVYAMGVVLYEALTARLPYDADDIVVLTRQIAEGTPVPLRSHAPHVPAALDAVVKKAMQVDPEQRYATMRDLIAALEGVRAAGAAVTTRPAAQHVATRAGFSTPLAIEDRRPRRAASSERPAEPPAPRRSRAPFIVIGTLLAIAIAVFGALVVVLVLKQKSRRAEVSVGQPDAGQGELVPAAPEPEPGRDSHQVWVGLRVTGACLPEWLGELDVRRPPADDAIVVSASPARGSSAITIRAPRSLTVPAAFAVRGADIDHALFIGVVDRTGNEWTNGTVPERRGDPVSGTVRFYLWDLARGRSDVFFDNVALKDANNPRVCRLHGRLRTTGYTNER